MKYQEVPAGCKEAVKKRLIQSFTRESLERFQSTVENNTRYDSENTRHPSFDELPEHWTPSLMPQLEAFLENLPEDSPLRSLPLENGTFKKRIDELIAQFKRECEEYCEDEEFLVKTSEEALRDIQIEKDGKIWLGGNTYPVWPVLYRWFGWWFFQPIRASIDISNATFVSEKDWKEEMGSLPMTWKTVNEYCARNGGKIVHRHEVVTAVQAGEITLSGYEWTEGGMGPCLLSPVHMGIQNTFGSLSGGTCFRYM